MATTLLEGLVSSALAGNELFESFFRAAGPCLLVEAWRDAGAPRAFDGTTLPGWWLVAQRWPSPGDTVAFDEMCPGRLGTIGTVLY